MKKKAKRKKKDVPMRKTTIRLPEDIWMRARIRALEEKTEFQTVVADALKAYLEAKRKGDSK